MSQFTSVFWDLFIGVISVVSVVACAIFLKAQSVRKAVEADTSGHTWDEDLTEYNNPLPRWWAWLFSHDRVLARLPGPLSGTW